MAISRRLRRSPAKRVSKKITQKRYRYPFVLTVGCNFRKVGEEDWNDVEDVSKLPKKIKDQLNLALLHKLYTGSTNQTDFTKVVYGKGKDYISLMGYAEHQLEDDMNGDGTLGSWIEAVNDKSIWQLVGFPFPTHAGKEYNLVYICLNKPKGVQVRNKADYCA